MVEITISPMAAVYGDLIRKDKKTLNQIPASLKEQVQQWLVTNGFGDQEEGGEA